MQKMEIQDFFFPIEEQTINGFNTFSYVSKVFS